jgi:hypothetical protein
MAVSKKSLEALEKHRGTTQFSRDNPPKNPGRKPSILRYIKDGGASVADIRIMLGSLIFDHTAQEIAKLLTDKKNPPPIGVSLVLGALSEDLKNKNLANFEKLLDRAYGKPTQKEIVEFTDVPDSAKDRLNRIFGDAQESSEKINPKLVSKTPGRKANNGK